MTKSLVKFLQTLFLHPNNSTVATLKMAKRSHNSNNSCPRSNPQPRLPPTLRGKSNLYSSYHTETHVHHYHHHTCVEPFHYLWLFISPSLLPSQCRAPSQLWIKQEIFLATARPKSVPKNSQGRRKERMLEHHFKYLFSNVSDSLICLQ